MDLSIILPIFNERENLEPLFAEIDKALVPHSLRYEIVAVDDGSTDGSREILRRLAGERSDLRVVFFRRNSGQSAAFDAGFRHASGRIVATMDADLQNDPADIPKLIDKLETEDLDVVTGWRLARKDGFILRKIPSRIANWLIRRVTGTRVHDLGCSLKVYRREITDELRLYGEMHRFLVPLAEQQGARVGEEVVHHRARHAGQSKYGIARTFKVMIDLVTVWFLHRYQTKPSYVFGGAGLVMIGLSLLTSFWVLWQKIGFGIWVHRNPLFLVAIVFGLLGAQSFGLGLLAEIVVRTYFEAQGRSPYPVKERIGFGPDHPRSSLPPRRIES